MANNLEQMCQEMEIGLRALRAQKKNYPNSKAFRKFLAQKERDYKEFLELVRPLRRDMFAPYVVRFLREKRADRKFFGMTQRTKDYFKITQKLIREIEAGN